MYEERAAGTNMLTCPLVANNRGAVAITVGVSVRVWNATESTRCVALTVSGLNVLG